MIVEIIFHTSSTPKKIDAYAVYTKGGLLCVQERKSDLIHKFPLCNVFSVVHKHKRHKGTTRI